MNLEVLCKNLKLLRTVHGMNQDELAAKIYITRSTYSAYETGSKVPDIQTLDALAAIYNIGFESLVNHDLSKGLLSRIYFVASKNVIMERLDVLLEREAVFYQEFAYPNKNMKK